jgi:hypothetical protein
MIISEDQAKTKWQFLNKILFQYQPLWQLKPFEYFKIPWQETYPDLANWVLNISDDFFKMLSRDPNLLNQSVYQFLPEIRDLDLVTQLPIENQGKTSQLNLLKKGVRGRKWEQIVGFVKSLPEINSPVLEWCSGKAHLGRLIAATHNIPVISLEKNLDLCIAGNRISQTINSPVKVCEVDVLNDSVFEYCTGQKHIVALHACGILHHRLLKVIKKTEINSISLSPCCYHRITDENYFCFSRYTSKLNLFQLDRHDLHLPLQDVVVASNRTIQLRQLETIYRLAFDVMQRDLTGSNHYLTVPSVPNKILYGGFKSFANWAAQKYDIPIPNARQLSEYEIQGKTRGNVFSRIELIRYVFRRALEMWLVLDIILYLNELGYMTSVGIFCKKSDTPRNIVIHANKI